VPQVSLYKSTEGWVFQSGRDRVWWDRLFQDETARADVAAIDRGLCSLPGHLASRRLPLPPPPLPARLPWGADGDEDGALEGVTPLRDLPLAASPATVTLKRHASDLVGLCERVRVSESSPSTIAFNSNKQYIYI